METGDVNKTRDMPAEFLPFAEAPRAGDKLLISKVYLYPVNIVERGLFMGLKLTQKTVIADASSGRLTAADGDVATAAYSPEPDADIKILPVSMSHKTAHALAEAYAVPDEAKGWKRGFRTSTLLFRHDDFKTAGRVYILRGGKLIDSFTGRSGDASALIDLLLGESYDKGGSPEV